MKLHLTLALTFIASVTFASAETLAPLTQAHPTATTALTTQRAAEMTRLRQAYLATLAEEMRKVPWSGRTKPERGRKLELCRIAGQPVLLRVADPPAPTIVPAQKAQTNPAREAPAEPATAPSPPLRR